MSIKLTELERHEAYLRLYGILTSLPIAKDKADEYLKLERKMAAELIKNWRQKYDLALKEIFKSIPEKISQEAKDIILNGLSESLGSNFGQSQFVRHLLQKYMRSAYETAKKEFAVKSHFNLSDSRAIEVLTKHNCFWLGEHYGKHIGPKISEMTQQAFENGLGRNEFANELREAFGGEVGGYKYWDIVSSAALVRARSFGAVSGMEEAGIAEYEILAMGDERTCPICDNMNGRAFSVAVARQKINEVLDIDDPAKFKGAMPWLSLPPIGMSNAELQDSGMSLPPFHGRCRCILIESSVVMPEANTVTEEVATEIPMAKTLEEARDIAIKYGLTENADFGELDIRAVNEILQGIYDNQKMFPELGKFDFVGDYNTYNNFKHELIVRMEFYKNPSKWRREYGYGNETDEEMLAILRNVISRSYISEELKYTTFAIADREKKQRGINFNPMFFSPQKISESITKTIPDCVKHKFHPVGCDTIKSIVDHEMGHQIDYMLNASEDPAILKLYDSYVYDNPFLPPPVEMKEVLSGYAEKNIQEFIAESWSEYKNNPDVRPVAKAVSDRILEIYKEKFKK